MGVIVPAILVKTRKELEEQLVRLEGLVDRVQIDVVDGRFIAPATWPYSEGQKEFAEENAEGGFLSKLGTFRYEMDLMVQNPEVVSGTWITAGASRLTIHAESTSFLARLIRDFKSVYGHDKDFAPDLLSIGLAINVESDTSLIAPYFEDIDYVQFMGIAHIGRQGEVFDTRVFRKIETFRKAYPDMQVQVDGGVTLENAPTLLSLGVNNLLVGSALSRAPDLATELQKFEALTEQYGLYR